MGKLSTSRFLVCATASAAAVALAVPAVSGSSITANSSKTKRVSVRDNLFSPRSARVGRGDKVAWRWAGDNLHNVRFRSVPRGASRRGSRTQTSGRFARTFRQGGRYRYVCTIHEDLGMRGSVRVE